VHSLLQCVEACGTDHQNTFAIAVAGRGFDARISTELAVTLPDSACVYCGNCIAVCPTGALMAKTEFDMRRDGIWTNRNESDRYDLSVLRRRMHADVARAGRRDREIDVAAGQLDHPWQSVHQGAIRWRFVQPGQPTQLIAPRLARSVATTRTGIERAPISSLSRTG